MKKLIAIVLLMAMLCPVTANAEAEREVRAVWITTAFGIDFPSVKNDAAAQKKEFSNMLDELSAIGINAVFVQVRPKSDAFYESAINPWSEFLTGTQGKDPGYDPLEYMVTEAHARGMELHAWLNPYRVTTSGTDLSALSATNPARLHPDWVISHNNALYYDPANAEVKAYIRDTVKEIVQNYDVDGIHFDDYFYPANYPLSAGEGKDGAEAAARRENINDMVRMVSAAIDSVSPGTEFGISPMGIWKNDASGQFGSVIKGAEGYYTVFADAMTWIEEGLIDYIAPQVYWESGCGTSDYNTIVKWWADVVNGSGVDLYIGEALYKDAVASEIGEHITFCRGISEVGGNVFFSTDDLLGDRGGAVAQLKTAYAAGGGMVATEEALPSGANIFINGKKVAFEAYNINGYNYFKLRDLAAALMETGSCFDLSWDEASKTIHIIPDLNYTLAGGELVTGTGAVKRALASDAVLKYKGNVVEASAYNIDGNNYFKLRDLGDTVGFGVLWNETERAVAIVTAG